MNNNTRLALLAFISSVENLAHSVSSMAGTNVLEEIYTTSEQLKSQLDKDETILN